MHLPFTKINGFIFLERTGPGVEDVPPSFLHLRILEGLEAKPSYVIHQGCGISPAFPFQGGRKSSTENFVPRSLSLSLPYILAIQAHKPAAAAVAYTKNKSCLISLDSHKSENGSLWKRLGRVQRWAYLLVSP